MTIESETLREEPPFGSISSRIVEEAAFPNESKSEEGHHEFLVTCFSIPVWAPLGVATPRDRTMANLASMGREESRITVCSDLPRYSKPKLNFDKPVANLTLKHTLVDLNKETARMRKRIDKVHEKDLEKIKKKPQRWGAVLLGAFVTYTCEGWGLLFPPRK